MKTNKSQLIISKAQLEVWEWLKKLYEATKDMSFVELREMLDDTMVKSAKLIGAKLVKNTDGSFRFV